MQNISHWNSKSQLIHIHSFTQIAKYVNFTDKSVLTLVDATISANILIHMTIIAYSCKIIFHIIKWLCVNYFVTKKKTHERRHTYAYPDKYMAKRFRVWIEYFLLDPTLWYLLLYTAGAFLSFTKHFVLRWSIQLATTS